MNTLAIVIPCYNEAARLPAAELENYIRQHSEVQLWLVNDGSTDGTGKVLKDLAQRHPRAVKVVELAGNCGKAEAVRRGVLACLDAGADFAAYFDADLATPLTEAQRLLVHLHQAGAVMAFSSRVKRLGIRLERSGIRHYLGRIFATEASWLLGLPVYDTQCGAKLFRREAASKLFDRPFVSRWFFDVEIFFRLRDWLGVERVQREVMEVPVSQWLEKGKSKIRLADFLCAPFELLRIRMAYTSRLQAR